MRRVDSWHAVLHVCYKERVLDCVNHKIVTFVRVFTIIFIVVVVGTVGGDTTKLLLKIS